MYVNEKMVKLVTGVKNLSDFRDAVLCSRSQVDLRTVISVSSQVENGKNTFSAEKKFWAVNFVTNSTGCKVLQALILKLDFRANSYSFHSSFSGRHICIRKSHGALAVANRSTRRKAGSFDWELSADILRSFSDATTIFENGLHQQIYLKLFSAHFTQCHICGEIVNIFFLHVMVKWPSRRQIFFWRLEK